MSGGRTEARPLHLQPASPLRVALEGPALRLEWSNRAVEYLPLRRISRIHASGRVDFTGRALAACGERGIVVIFHDEGEQPVARLVGRGRAHAALRQRLLDLMDRPDWQERYGDWKHAGRRRIASTLVHRLHAPRVLAMHPDALVSWLDEEAEKAAGAEAARLTRSIFHQQATGWMQAHLLEQGIDARDECWLVGGQDLAADLAELLAFRMESLRIGWLRGRARAAAAANEPPRPPSRRLVVRRLEYLAPRMERLGRDLVNRLHRWLVETA